MSPDAAMLSSSATRKSLQGKAGIAGVSEKIRQGRL
jgi:hypothetical protein